MTAKLRFRDVNGHVLLEQNVEIKSVASYPVPYKRHGPKLAGPADLGCWVKAIGAANENKAGTMYSIELESHVPNPYDPYKWATNPCVVAKWLHQDLAVINCAGPAAYPGPGLGWTMNFMPIRAAWCIPANLPWLQAGGGLAGAGAPATFVGSARSVLHGSISTGQGIGPTTAQQRDAFLRAVFAPDTVAPPTVRSTKYITPRAQRTPECPCGVHYSGCNLHDDWLEVD